jgi:hypothetical protein
VRPAADSELSTFGLDAHRRDRGTHIALWVGQIVLAVVFGVAGAAKLVLGAGELAALAPWTAALPAALIDLIGAAELAGALGLVLPALTGVRPGLTPLAATALAAEMALAAAFHVARAHPRPAALAIALGLTAAAVAWGRLRVSRIAPRPPPPLLD